MTEKECKHEYKDVVTTTQEAVTTRHNFQDHVIAILEIPVVTIFCTRCGDSKIIKEQTKAV